MDEVEDFPDDLAYDSDEEEYDALNDETFGSDAIGDEDWEQSHEALAGLSQEQNELEARLATLWQDEDNIPQEQGSEDLRPEVPVTTNPTKSPLKEFSVLDAFRRDGKFSLAHIPPPPLPAHTHKDVGRHLPMAFLPRQESPGIPFLTPTGRGMRLGRPDMVPPMMPPGMLPQNRGFVARNMLLPPPPARLLYLPQFGRMDREHGLGLRPRFPAHHQPMPHWIQPGFRPPTHLNGEYHPHHHHHQQQHHQHPRWDHDPYNGLMTTKERQWLYNIQQLQLSTDKPYIDDYYYTVFVSRRGDPSGGSFVTEHRERRDSVRDKPYTPMQFQNSLGKLQAGSVTSPRKLLDLEVVSNEGMECPTTAPPKDTQRCKQMLLEIEKLYLFLLKLEDSVSPHLEAREIVTETKQELLTNIFTSLLHKDWLVAIMAYRKGKMLILRLLPHLAQPEVDHQLCGVWVRILGGLPAVSRRDGPLLMHLYPHYKRWLERATPVRVLQLCSSLVSGQGPMRSSRLFLVVGNKFGISALEAILERMQVMYSALEPHLREEWSSFLSALMEAIHLAASVRSLSPPIEVMDAGILSRHLQDWSEDSANMCAVFERAFSSQPIVK